MSCIMSTITVLMAVLVIAALGVSCWSSLAQEHVAALLGALLNTAFRRMSAARDSLTARLEQYAAGRRGDELMLALVGAAGLIVGAICIASNFLIYRENFCVVFSYQRPAAGVLAIALSVAIAMVAIGMHGIQTLLISRRAKVAICTGLAVVGIGIMLFQAALTKERIETIARMREIAAVGAPTAQPGSGRLRIAGGSSPDATLSAPSAVPAARPAIGGTSATVEAALPVLVGFGDAFGNYFGLQLVYFLALALARTGLRIERRLAGIALFVLPDSADEAERTATLAVAVLAAVGDRALRLMRLVHPLHIMSHRIERTEQLTELEKLQARAAEGRREAQQRAAAWCRQQEAEEHQATLRREREAHRQLLDLKEHAVQLEWRLQTERAEADARIKELLARARNLEAALDQERRRSEAAQAEELEQRNWQAEQLRKCADMAMESLQSLPAAVHDDLHRTLVDRLQVDLHGCKTPAEVMVKAVEVFVALQSAIRRMVAGVEQQDQLVVASQ